MLGKLATLGVAVVALVLAILLLRDAIRGAPVAGTFTRVGGSTRVETAVEASGFWTHPPPQVVTTPKYAPLRLEAELWRPSWRPRNVRSS